MLLRDFGPYVIIFMNICTAITVAMVILLRDFEPSEILLHVSVQGNVTVGIITMLNEKNKL
jgi:hypothetical protein